MNKTTHKQIVEQIIERKEKSIFDTKMIRTRQIDHIERFISDQQINMLNLEIKTLKEVLFWFNNEKDRLVSYKGADE